MTEHTKATVYEEISKRSEGQRQAGETREMAFARFITKEEDGRALYRVYKAVRMAPKVVEMVVAEFMSSYRSQVEPPSRSVQ